jgi:hypothetical protein
MPHRIPRLRYVEIDRDVDLCLPLIRPIGLTPLSGGIRDGAHPRVASPPVPSTHSSNRLTQPAADIRDEAHRRAAPAPRCPGSVAAHSAGQARP